MKAVRSRKNRLLATIAALALMLSMLTLNFAPAVAYEDTCVIYDEHGTCIVWYSDIVSAHISWLFSQGS